MAAGDSFLTGLSYSSFFTTVTCDHYDISFVFPSDCQQCSTTCRQLIGLMPDDKHCAVDAYDDSDHALYDSDFVVMAICETFPVKCCNRKGKIIRLDIHGTILTASQTIIRCTSSNVNDVAERIIYEINRVENVSEHNMYDNHPQSNLQCEQNKQKQTFAQGEFQKINHNLYCC